MEYTALIVLFLFCFLAFFFYSEVDGLLLAVAAVLDRLNLDCTLLKHNFIVSYGLIN